MGGTKKFWSVEEWRAEFKRAKDKDQERIYNGMQRLTREVFTAAMVHHLNMGEALMSVYLTGMYHAVEIQKCDAASAQLQKPNDQ